MARCGYQKKKVKYAIGQIDSPSPALQQHANSIVYLFSEMGFSWCSRKRYACLHRDFQKPKLFKFA
jgi:hypothetical protein